MHIFNKMLLSAQSLKQCESESEVTQSCPTLCDPMGCSLPGSSVHGILQARILEWVAIRVPKKESWNIIKLTENAVYTVLFTRGNLYLFNNLV